MRQFKEIIVDSFAGGGGASLGIGRATGRPVDVAINHDAAAIAMHAANHPETLHLTEDVWKVATRSILRLRRRRGRWQLPPEGWQEWPASRRVGLLWASPDCKHFSRAKGSKPVSKTIRSLAWVIVKWAAEVRPRMIMLENVREFADWGPVVPALRCKACNWRGTEGQATLKTKTAKCPSCHSRRLKVTDEQIPDPDRKGVTFKRFVGRLRKLGYAVDWKNLNAADYGADTHRRRLFLIARCDGQPIVWPEPTHGDPKKIGERSLFEPLKPWGTAAECIDWSLALGGGGRMGQSPAAGVDQPSNTATAKNDRAIVVPVIASLAHGDGPKGSTFSDGRSKAPTEPLGTVHAGGNNHALVTPYLAPLTHQGDDRTRSVEQPMPTTTTAHRGETALISPTLIQVGYGERPELWRCSGCGHEYDRTDLPACGCAKCGSEADPIFVKAQEPRVPGLDKPLGSVVAGGQKHALIAAFVAKHFGGAVGTTVDSPLPTTLTQGRQNQLASATLIRMNHDDAGVSIDSPLPTQTTSGHAGLVAANLIHLNHGEKQWSSVDEPLRTNTTANHAALVYSFLVRYFGTAIGQHVTEPLFTITGKDRFGLVTVTIDGEPYVIVDIGMRMLTPRELARAQGFPDSYVLTGTKSSQVARIGNSVCPVMAQTLVRANYTPCHTVHPGLAVDHA